MTFRISKNSLIFIGIIIIAAIPRAIELINGNYLFGFDQGLFYQAVRDIVVNHHITLIGAPVGGRGGFFQGPGWYYLLAIPFILAHGDPYGGMVLMFILGIGTVISAYILGSKILDQRAGIIIAVLIAISPTLISQSRFIWPPFPVSFLSVFFLFFFFKVLQNKKKFLPLVALSLGLMFHFEAAIGMTLLLQFIIFSPVLFWKRFISIKSFLSAVLVFVLTQSPLIFFDLRHRFIITKGILGSFFQGSNSSHHVTQMYVKVMADNHLGIFLSSFMSIIPFRILSPYIWILLIVICVFWYVLMEKDQAKRIFIIYLTTSPILLFGVFMFYLWPMWEWWILELPIMYLFLFGILIDFLLKKKGFNLLAILLIGFFFSYYLSQTFNYYKNDLHDYGGTAKIKGKLQAIDYIYQDAEKKPFGVLAFTPPIYTYDTDYLFWWHGQKKYNYSPYHEKKGIVYLIIENDPAKPWSSKGWLETVIKTGKVINTKTLSSGYIVQKREF